MEFHGHIIRGKFTLTDAQRLLRQQWLTSLPEGTAVSESLRRVTHPKTAKQLATHFGLVIETVRRTFEERGWDLALIVPSQKIPPGLPVPAEVIQAILYATCNDVGDAGERKRLSKMNTIEGGRFFDKCRNYIAAAWNIRIPDPDPNWRMKR
ncbi:MAG: hypothetical protein V2A79_10255 [Planctomycetota bacterium]